MAPPDPEEELDDALLREVIARHPEIEPHRCPICGHESALGDPELILVCLHCAGVSSAG